MPGSQGRVSTAVLTVDGEAIDLIHRSVLDRVAEIAGRLGCRQATALGRLPVSFAGAGLPRLRRDLELVVAFADAARNTGWVLGDLAVAPGEHPVPVLDTPQGRLWAHPARGFELHGPAGTQRVTRLPQLAGPARRAPLTEIITPLAEAVALARVLELNEEGVGGDAP